MPRSHFKIDLARYAGVDLTHVLRLSDRYDMSREATVRRYVDFNDEPCAVVFSRNGVVRYPYTRVTETVYLVEMEEETYILVYDVEENMLEINEVLDAATTVFRTDKKAKVGEGCMVSVERGEVVFK